MPEQPREAIAYIAQTFPALTQTFVYREVWALEALGFEVSTFAIWPPNEKQLSPEARPLVARTQYVFPIRWGKFLEAHLHFLLTRPGRYLEALWFVMTRPGESFRQRRRTFGHFFEAIYLAREIERRKIRHIHAHFAINAATLALVIARLLDISFSFTAHNIFFTDRLLLREKVHQARFVVAISDFTKQFLLRLAPGEGHAEKIHIIHCGLSPELFAPLPRPANPTPILLFVAQLVERKGTPVLIEACRILQERGIAFRCVIVGDGPEMALLKSRVEQYGLQDAVQLTGALPQEQVREWLALADVFVLPCITARDGDMDGVPVSLMEAMAMAIPTVSTTVSGIPELIADGVNGLLAPEKDAEALAGALQRLLEDTALGERLGRAAREQVSREFNIHQNAAQLAALFAQYLRPTHE